MIEGNQVAMSADSVGHNTAWTLDIIDVASPCSAAWEGMRGDDVTRFCGDCKLRVYNLSGMTRAEAQALVQRREGRMCVRFVRRADGTVLTRDCPVGLRAIRRRVARLAAGALALLGFVAFGGWSILSGTNSSSGQTAAGTLDRAYQRLFPPEFVTLGSLFCVPDHISQLDHANTNEPLDTRKD